jgi:hypothetical protein
MSGDAECGQIKVFEDQDQGIFCARELFVKLEKNIARMFQ